MRINRWKTKKNNLICGMLLIPYFEPLLFKEERYALFDKMYSIFKIIGFVIIVLLFVKNNFKDNKIRMSQCLKYIILLEIFALLSTIFHNGDIVKYCGPAVSVLSLSLLTEVFLHRIKYNYFRIIRDVLLCLTIVNIVFQIIYPNGIITGEDIGAGVHFLGIDNRLIFFYIPLIFFSCLYDLYKYKKITLLTYVLVAFTLWSTLSLWAVGGFLGILLMSFSLIIGDKIRILKKISMRQLILADLLANVLVVFFQIQKYFEYFIVDILHKDLTLTGRTYLWNWAIESFVKHPISGFGIQSNAYLLKIYGWVAHPHNMFLNYLTTTGIVGFCIFMSILFISSRNVEIIQNKRVVVFCNYTVFVILFLAIADTLDAAAFYIIYMVINFLALNEKIQIGDKNEKFKDIYNSSQL